MSTSTYEEYETTIRVHVLPALGNMQAQALRAAHLDAFYADKITSGTSPVVVAKCHQRIAQALKYARKIGLVAINHADGATPPPVRKKEMHVWTAEQARRFLSVVDRSTYGCLWLIYLGTGMRRGEGLGLRWKDVDWEQNTLQVCQTVGIAGGKALIKPMPKTDFSRRVVAADPSIFDALRRHRERQDEQRSMLGDAWQHHDLIFPSAVGTPIWPENLTRDYNRLVEKAGVPRIRIHDQRHTYASLAIKQGANILAVSRQLGHARPSTTSDIYGHVDSQMQRQVSDAVAGLLFDPKPIPD